MDHFTWQIMLVKVALAALGSVASISIMPPKTRRSLLNRFFWGIIGGVTFGQWLYRVLYEEAEIIWEALAGCLFTCSFVIYFIMAIFARTLAKIESVGELIDITNDLKDVFKMKRTSRSKERSGGYRNDPIFREGHEPEPYNGSRESGLPRRGDLDDA